MMINENWPVSNNSNWTFFKYHKVTYLKTCPLMSKNKNSIKKCIASNMKIRT